MLALVLGLGAITITSLLSARIAEKVYDGKAIDMRLSNHPSLVVVQELKHENIFRNTIKSCLTSENSKCKTFIPTVNGTEKQRIAIISSPGDAASSVYTQIVPLQNQYNHRSNQAGPEIDVFLRTSVPPYGYGKTHGLTRIIRLVPQPLALEVTDALRTLLKPGESHTVIALSDLKAALRQILRFHCRLSAVAAHTALLSINYQEMTTDMANVVKKIDTFLGANDPTLGIGKRGGKVLESDQGGLFDAPQSFGVSKGYTILMFSSRRRTAYSLCGPRFTGTVVYTPSRRDKDQSTRDTGSGAAGRTHLVQESDHMAVPFLLVRRRRAASFRIEPTRAAISESSVSRLQ